MKKFLSIILVITMLLLPLNGATVNAVIPGEDTYNSNDLKIYEYDVATGNISTTTLGEIRSKLDPSLLAASAVNGVKTSMGYTPKEEIREPITVDPKFLSGFWVRIGSTTGERYKRTVRLSVKAPNGKYYTGSGFMIGPSTVATAGHLLYNRKYYGGNYYAVSITVSPAFNNGTSPYGTASATSYTLMEGWTVNYNSNYDWAVISLNKNIGDSTGWLSLRYQSSSYNGTSVDVLGYPEKDETGTDIDGMYMHRSTGTISQTLTRMLYSTDTNVLGGMSGGPVQHYYADTGYTAIGIVCGGLNDNITNAFVRINKEVYDFFMDYRNVRV